MGRTGGLMIQSSPILQDGQVTNCRNIILQRFSYRNESSEPHIRLVSPEVQHQEDESRKHLTLKDSGA